MNLISNIQTCHEIIQESVPLALIYYSHIGLAGVALSIGIFVLWNNRSFAGVFLFALSFFFASWAVIDIFLWTSADSRVYMYLWPIANILEAYIFLSTFLFFFAFLKKGDDSLRTLFCFLLTVPLLVFAWTPHNLIYFDIGSCVPIEAWFWENYVFPLQLAITGWIFVAGIYSSFRGQKGTQKSATLLITIGTVSFLVSFMIASWIVILADFNYLYEIIAFAGMAVFLWFLSFLIVRYQSFNIKILGAQALVFALVAAVLSQFLYASGLVDLTLNAFSTLLVIIFGYLLIKSVKREVEQRKRIEELAHELEKSNRHQVTLIHFITHQLKGFMTKSRNIFSMIKEGDYGVAPEPMSPLIDEGIRSATKGAQTIEEILNASNIKSGKVTYAKEPVDLNELVASLVADQKGNAEAKGLALTYVADGEGFVITGDRMQLTNAYKNMIDNAVKYTMQGSVTVTLNRTNDCIRFTVADTGVGITPEDMKILFTEGGHGAESRKVNVESTGFGLYIVKNIIDAHHGKVWAESEGAGKGSTFIVELPVS